MSLARRQAPSEPARMLLRKLLQENEALRTAAVETTSKNQRLKKNLGL